jgi:lysyl endopeptidase
LAAVDTVRVDLAPLIEKAAANPEQFAVEVPHFVALTRAGNWSAAGNKRTLRYAVSVPGAVSLSFHASRAHLPPSATLVVSSTATTVIYRAADVHDDSLWSRIQPGDALEFTLEVQADEAELVALDISGLQVGYRGLSPGVRSHEAYRRLRIHAAGDPDTHCVQNYACNVTAENRQAGQATVALTVSNRYLCTGTLVNNTARDNTPYILTARHCATGDFVTSVSDAPYVTVYWNAVSACGEALGTVLYSPNPSRQTGAKTVYAQQDTWLLRLDAGPVVDDAFLAGFDAGAGDVDGGYSIHHSLAYNKQFTRWHGRAFRFVMPADGFLPAPLDLLAVVNESGVSGPGASGGALFSQDHRVVGVASLAPISSTQSGYGQCPAATPPSPDESNGSVLFNSLAAVWNTQGMGILGSVTLKSLLDPQNTGATSVDSMVANRLQFTAWNSTQVNTFPTTLQWTSNAASCNASGGVPGDLWTGTLPGSGTRQVAYSGEGEITYRLVCPLASGGTVSGSVTVRWTAPVPATYASVSQSVAWPTVPVELKWKSNYGPCSVAVLNGAQLRADLPSEGTLVVTSAVPAIPTYRVTCGATGQSSYANASVNYMPPVLEMVSSGTSRRPGEIYRLEWGSHADTCIPTGGSPGDDWSGIVRGGTGGVMLDLKTKGTFEYGLRCTGGSLTQSKSFTLVVDDSPPFIELLPVRTTVNLAFSPADYIRYSFRTNLSDCTREITGINTRNLDYVPGASMLPGFINPEGEAFFAPYSTGTGTLTFTCRPWPFGPNAGGPGASASIPFTVLPPLAPTASISASATTLTYSGTLTITWSSTSSTRCMLEEIPPAGASSTVDYAEPAGSKTLQGNGMAVGNWEYRVLCLSIDGMQPAASASVRFRVEGPVSNPPPATGGGGGGGSSDGGGGSTGLADLLLLCGLLALRRSR